MITCKHGIAFGACKTCIGEAQERRDLYAERDQLRAQLAERDTLLEARIIEFDRTIKDWTNRANRAEERVAELEQQLAESQAGASAMRSALEMLWINGDGTPEMNREAHAALATDAGKALLAELHEYRVEVRLLKALLPDPSKALLERLRLAEAAVIAADKSGCCTLGVLHAIVEWRAAKAKGGE